jgi:hypothetical protein
MRRSTQRRALILGLIPVVMAAAACSSPAPPPPLGPPVTTTQPAGAYKFISEQYHFQVTVPKGWTGLDSESAWDGTDRPPPESPEYASATQYFDAAQSMEVRAFAFGSMPLAKGTTLAAWRAALVRDTECPDARSAKKTTLGGEPALVWTAKCPDLSPVRLAVIHGTRGYYGIIVPAGARINTADKRLYDPILQSFHFTG